MAGETKKRTRSRSKPAGSASKPASKSSEKPQDPAPAPDAAKAEPSVELAGRNPSDETTNQALTLYLDDAEYAIPILRVREIASYESVTPVPTTPVWIRGVMNLRGTVVPVVDLRAKLGLGRTTITKRTCLVIVELVGDGEETVMAVVVDGVNRVIDLSPEDVQEAPAFGTQVDVGFLDGLIHLEERLILLLDLNRILSAVHLRDLRETESHGSDETVARSA